MGLQTNQLLNSVHHPPPPPLRQLWNSERILIAEFRRLRFKFQLGHWLALWTSQNTKSLYCLLLSPANRQTNTNPKSVGGARTLPGGCQPRARAELWSTCPPFRGNGASFSPHCRLSLTQLCLHPSLLAPENVVRPPQGLHPKHFCSHFTQLPLQPPRLGRL